MIDEKIEQVMTGEVLSTMIKNMWGRWQGIFTRSCMFQNCFYW